MIEKVCGKLDDLEHPKKAIAVFLLTWGALAVLQAFFTELAHDEAYYWLYSRKLDWGYFDHPPMIALIIRVGYSLFQSELGVRLIPLLLGTGTIYIIYLLVKDELKSISTLFLILLSIIILKSHVGGFLAIPDVPVIFFAALFFYLYKLYVSNDNILSALLLGLIGAAMLYSKYHGVLVLFFTLLSNINLFKRKTFYAIPAIIVIAMLPHLFWQIENGFPTFEYHLVSRSSDYRIVFTLDYLLGQLLIAGPLVGAIIYIFAVKRNKEEGLFYRAMRFNFYGFFLFFLLMSFKGRVEAHWTAIGFIPAIVLSVNNIYENKKALLWMRRLFLPTIIIFLLIRLSLVVQIVPPKYNIGSEFHNWDIWAQEIKQEANGSPVVFGGTFQRPSKYAFYTGGEFAHSLNYLWYRKNQFDLWGYSDSIKGKTVALFRAAQSTDTLCTVVNECYAVKHIDDFKLYYDIPIEFEKNKVTAQPSDSVNIAFKVINSTNDTLEMNKVDTMSPRFVMSIYNGTRFISIQKLEYVDTLIAPHDSIGFKQVFKVPVKSGHNQCYISIVNDGLYPGFNGKPFELIIE